MILGAGLLSSVSSSSSIPHILYFYEVLLGFGFGGVLVSTILMVKLNASEEDAGTATPLSPSTSTSCSKPTSIRPRPPVPSAHPWRQHRPRACNYNPQHPPKHRLERRPHASADKRRPPLSERDRAVLPTRDRRCSGIVRARVQDAAAGLRRRRFGVAALLLRGVAEASAVVHRFGQDGEEGKGA